MFYMKIKRKKGKGTEGMVKFIGKRLAYAVLTLFLITTATFFLVAGAPGDPIAAKVGQMPEQAQEIIREKYGLDQPVVKRYTTYMKNLLTTGDFGESIIYTGQSANDIIKNKSQLETYNKRIRQTFETIKDVYGRDCEINVFPAMPVSIAVETGRCWMKKAHPRLTIYDEKNGFKKSLEIKYEGEDE